MAFNVKQLPPENLDESKDVLRKLASAHRFLAELKGVAATIPNQAILINTLALQEAKDSSAIENIITTHDELFKAQLFADLLDTPAAKEVSRYVEALKYGFERVKKNEVLTLNHILEIQQRLEKNDAGIRKLSGTVLLNQATHETVYVPPQDYETVLSLMDNLVEYINRPEMHSIDPLVKMAVIHHQFETIHPFYDGNGRTGRILNLLYLVLQGLLNTPILYLSRSIIRQKSEYYRLLQHVRDTGEWADWILFMLSAVEETAQETILLVEGIRDLMLDYKHRIRAEYPRLYSQDLLNNLFRHPYTKIEFVMHDLSISRITATNYLNHLANGGFLVKEKIWRTNYYVNMPLFNLLKGETPSSLSIPPIVTSQSTQI